MEWADFCGVKHGESAGASTCTEVVGIDGDGDHAQPHPPRVLVHRLHKLFRWAVRRGDRCGGTGVGARTGSAISSSNPSRVVRGSGIGASPFGGVGSLDVLELCGGVCSGLLGLYGNEFASVLMVSVNMSLSAHTAIYTMDGSGNLMMLTALEF